jgi:hypothetical protein
VKLSDLTPNPQNPRKISDEQLTRLKKSMQAFGDISGFVWNRETKRLVGAHQRKKCMPDDAEVIIEMRHDVPTAKGTVASGHVWWEGERWSYREVLWSEATEKAANLAANKHGGEFEIEAVKDWLHQLDALNVDLDLTGFGPTELVELMAPIGGEEVDISGDAEQYRLEVLFSNPGDMNQLYEELLGRNILVRVMSK